MTFWMKQKAKMKRNQKPEARCQKQDNGKVKVFDFLASGFWLLAYCLWFLASGLLLLASTSQSHAMSVEELQQKMAESESRVTSMEFDYQQQMESSLTSEKRISEGKVYIKKPKQVRIEQKTPENQTIVTSGKSVYIYTPRFQQVIEQRWEDWFTKNMFFPGLSGFSDALKKLKKEYRWQIQSSAGMQDPSTIWVRLVKENKDGKEQLDLWIGISDFLPKVTQYTYQSLKLTTSLVSLKTNTELDPQLFKFKKPADAKIIRIK
jgi:chaperone LolA